jgi:hypothetical protein
VGAIGPELFSMTEFAFNDETSGYAAGESLKFHVRL